MATPAMGLAVATPNVTQALGVAPPGQSWGELFNANFGIVDTHTHAPGSGSPVPTAGIAINADLPFGGFNATNLRSTRFSGITLGSLGVNDKNCLLASSGDLYFVDGAGNQVRITSAGGVAGTPGAIGGLVSPAAATYTPGSKLFTFTSSTPRVAGIACGPLTIGDASVDNGNGVTISAPAGLAGNYALSLPAALPGSDGLLRLSTTGALSAFGTIAGSDLTIPGNFTLAGILTNNAAARAFIQSTAANSTVQVRGNRAATDAGADVETSGQATRTAGLLVQINNNSVPKLNVDFQGLLALAAQPGPLQPSSVVNALGSLTAGWTAINGAGYWKDATGRVQLRGGLTNNTGGASFTPTLVGALPAGFLPSSDRTYTVRDSNLVINNVTIKTTGQIILNGNVANGFSFSLDGISYLAEA